MKRIALTGGIATGKTYVAGRIRDAGVPVVDADALARQVVAPGSEGFHAVVARFGRGILNPEGFLDRPKLGAIVFSNPAARRDLEGILHPLIRAAISRFFDELPDDVPFAVADIPLLYETRREKEFDKVIVAAAPREVQIARVVARDGLSREDAERRLAAQLPIDEKVRRADFVIDTNGDYERTDEQVAGVLRELRA